MLDHGQLGPPTPAMLSRRGSTATDPDISPSSFTGPNSRRGSTTQSEFRRGSTGAGLAMTSISASALNKRLEESFSSSAFESDDDDEKDGAQMVLLARRRSSKASISRRSSTGRGSAFLSKSGFAAMSTLDDPVRTLPDEAKKLHVMSLPSSEALNSKDLDKADKLESTAQSLRISSTSPNGIKLTAPKKSLQMSPPILVNAICSGYFIEPVCLQIQVLA